VALVPDVAGRLVKARIFPVVIERGAGVSAGFPDTHYTAVGATIGDAWSAARAKVQNRVSDEIGKLPERRDAGRCAASRDDSADLLRQLAQRRVTAFSLELLARITARSRWTCCRRRRPWRVQGGADRGGRIPASSFPMMVTAAGRCRRRAC